MPGEVSRANRGPSNTSPPVESQIAKMKHAIGLDYHKPKRGKYHPSRNHYRVSECGDADWEASERDGYAIKSAPYMYHVSPKGLKWLETLIGAKITDWENVGRWGAICGNCRCHGNNQVCVMSAGRWHGCKTKPTTKCREHRFKDGLAHGGLKR